MDTRILIVDGDVQTCRQFERALRLREYLVESVGDVEGALARLEDRRHSLVFVSFDLPGEDVRYLLDEIGRRWPDLDVVATARKASIPGAVEAMKQGVVNYLAKPLGNEDVLAETERLLEQRRILDTAVSQRESLLDRYSFGGMIARSPRMHEVFARIEALAQTDQTVLLRGETGTGKSLCARALHLHGPRRSERLIAINCVSLPDSFLASEMVAGDPRGGGSSEGEERRHGDGGLAGTLLLDKVEALPAMMQSRLLPLLESVRGAGMGEGEPARPALRVVAASSADLEALAASGAIREDFYYRLNVVPVHIPALRERLEDLPLLVSCFLGRSRLAREKGIDRVSKKALLQLMAHSWPGNLWELGNVLERAVLRARGTAIGEVELPSRARQRRRA